MRCFRPAAWQRRWPKPKRRSVMATFRMNSMASSIRCCSKDRWEDAATEARAGLATAEELGAHLYDPLGATVLALVAVRRGDLETAAGYADHCRSHDVPGLDVMSAWWWVNWCPALVAEAQGGPERA